MNAGNAQPLSEWIVAQGLLGTDETKVLDALCARLTAEGLPLLRVNICQPTLHPVIGGHLFIWQRGRAGRSRRTGRATWRRPGATMRARPSNT